MQVIFGAWHQNRGGILQVCTKSDYTEVTNIIWPLLPNFTQSNVHEENLVKYECDICEKSYNKEQSLKNHFLIAHDNSHRHKCTFCEKTFGLYFQLKSHINQIHSSQGKTQLCHICNKRFRCLSLLKTHISCVHKKEKINFCEDCGKWFGRKQDLNQHIKRNHKKI